jgi:hypothetical protein
MARAVCRGSCTGVQAEECKAADIRRIIACLRKQHPDLNTNCGKGKRNEDTAEYYESDHEVHSFFMKKRFQYQAQ